MADPIGRWGHSFEEDHDDVTVYRPADFDFPRARGRDGIEFCSDGSYVDWAIGRGDAPVRRAGTWSPDVDSSQLNVTTAAGDRKVMRVLSHADDRLDLHITDEI
ncbi:hypothetical protein [Antrihabitans cavernicola]|uniref:hypothetical protein n=1 Tax=Antrihabitans cavernicola TaxID=2495913 RepID=UPI001659F45B|nr:hypothetical protein [Spelaeibacter cavernicola]